MTTVTIPRQLAKRGDLVLIPRDEYEELLHFRIQRMKEVPMTVVQKRALERARKNVSQNKFLTPHEFKQKLALKN